MAKYIVSANGTEFGTYEANSEQEARDLCAQDAGYKSEADMVERPGLAPAADYLPLAAIFDALQEKAASMSINTLTLKSQSESVAAPAEVGQGQGTITVQELLRWLDKKAAAARQAIKEGCDFSDRKCVHEPAIDYCRIASALIREFIQERAA